MSYQSEKQKMEQSAARTRKLWGFVIQITVIVLAAAFLALGVSIFAFEILGNQGDEPLPSGKAEKPVITANAEEGYIYAVFGENISYKKYVSFSGGDLSVDYSAVDPTKEGVYPVVYTVKSSSGKTAKLTLHLVLKKATYTLEALDALLVERIIPKLGITEGMTVEQKVRKIFDYVNSPSKSASAANIVFTDESNTPSVDRSLWKTDWVEEAYRTVESGEGDCYSYYSLSRALFEYYGIENVGIRRNDSASNMGGTHFWSMVNIGTKQAPKWYFYDSTRLGGTFANGKRQCCLLTEAELNGYSPSDPDDYGFYAYDKTGLPTPATESLS